jgi:hypothetical protein
MKKFPTVELQLFAINCVKKPLGSLMTFIVGRYQTSLAKKTSMKVNNKKSQGR